MLLFYSFNMNYYYNLVVRSSIALLIPLDLLLYILTPLTIYPIYFIMQLLKYNPKLSFDAILINNYSLIFAPACIAVGAYYFLSLLVLFTKDIKLKDRVYCILLGSLLIWVMNIIRVTILIVVVINYGENWFELIHMTFWYAVSGVYAALIWIFLVYLFKIKSIPVYSDLKYLYKRSIFK